MSDESSWPTTRAVFVSPSPIFTVTAEAPSTTCAFVTT